MEGSKVVKWVVFTRRGDEHTSGAAKTSPTLRFVSV
jgi:hypothetical protein